MANLCPVGDPLFDQAQACRVAAEFSGRDTVGLVLTRWFNECDSVTLLIRAPSFKSHFSSRNWTL